MHRDARPGAVHRVTFTYDLDRPSREIRRVDERSDVGLSRIRNYDGLTANYSVAAFLIAAAPGWIQIAYVSALPADMLMIGGTSTE